jgi:hypothetical protein
VSNSFFSTLLCLSNLNDPGRNIRTQLFAVDTLNFEFIVVAFILNAFEDTFSFFKTAGKT